MENMTMQELLAVRRWIHERISAMFDSQDFNVHVFAYMTASLMNVETALMAKKEGGVSK